MEICFWRRSKLQCQLKHRYLSLPPGDFNNNYQQQLLLHKDRIKDNCQWELLGFCTWSIVWYSEKHYRAQRFGNWICFHPQVRGQTPTLSGPLENAGPVIEVSYF
jgi:hypothetical protein